MYQTPETSWFRGFPFARPRFWQARLAQLLVNPLPASPAFTKEIP
jgi:hypothetical protein